MIAEDVVLRRWLTHAAPHEDLREFLDRAEEAGEIRRITGASWDLELGALAEIVTHARTEAPALLFEDIAGATSGFRVVSASTNSTKRLALTLGFPPARRPTDLVLGYRERMKTFAPIPPRMVRTGPILENVDRDGDVDLWKFPVPLVHEHDGGRYIGTEDLVVMRDPEGGWVNVATYRVMVHDKNHVGIWMSPGKHGRRIVAKYHAEGRPAPVLICCGQDPLLFLAANHEVPFEIHGLPMPASAEIVLEGQLYPGDAQAEGPFGEFTGYYASPQSDQPVVRIERVYHRNDPIMTMATPMRPPTDVSFSKALVKSGMIWDEIERAGVAGVKGIWCHESGVVRMFVVVAIKQAYAGHAKQAAQLVANCQSGAYMGKFVVVVDDDVDPTDLFDVLWAMCTRCDPVADIDFVRNAWASPLDPMIEHEAKSYVNSRAIIDACRPFDRLKDFPRVARATPDLLERVRVKFAPYLGDL
jgi:3-polyprenyl-4-hydroxybenzoate decarboxylase